MASLGRTYNFRPAAASPIAKTVKMRTITKNMALDLDIHNLLHDAVADQLQHDGPAQHHVAYVVFEEELAVVGIGIEHKDRHRDRDAAQGSGGHFSVRAYGADASAKLESLANYIGQLVQN